MYSGDDNMTIATELSQGTKETVIFFFPHVYKYYW